MQQQLDVLTGGENAFLLQPVSRGYMNLYRALATAIIYRFTRVNCGYGASEAELADADRIDEARAARSAIRVRSTPGHVIQVIFAQWLAVYVGLQLSHGSAVGTFLVVRTVPAGVEVINDPRAVLTDADGCLSRIQTGSVVLAPFAALAYLVDWYGAALPAVHAYRPATTEYQQELLPLAKVLLLSTLPKASPVGVAFRTGLAAEERVVFAALDKLCKGGEVQVRAVHGATRLCKIRLAAHGQLMGALDDVVQPWAPEDREAVPPTVSLSAVNMELLLQPTAAVVVMSSAGKVADALLNRMHEDTPLLYLAVNASIAAVSRARAGAAPSDVTAQVWALYPFADKGTLQSEVKRALLAESPRAKEAVGAAGATVVPKPLQVPLRPGRWFTKGPSTVTAYIMQREYRSKDVSRALAALVHFFSHHAVVRDEATGRAFVTVDGVPKTELVKRGSEGEEAVFEQRPVRGKTAQLTLLPKTELPFHAVVLSRENLLWFAAVEADRPRAILETLWNGHHVCHVTGRRFDDAATAGLIRTVISRQYTHAQKWSSEAMMELLFMPEDAAAAALLTELDQLMMATAVTVTGGETYYGARLRGLKCEATHVFRDVAGGGDDLVLVPLQPAQQLSVDRWSEWFVHGVCCTTTQLALLFAAGDTAVVAALRTLTDACVVRNLGMGPDFRQLAQTDKMELYKRFSEQPVRDNMSALTLTA